MFEYELDINFEVINKEHLVNASKDRTQLFNGKPEFIITEETGKMILDWCNKGVSSIDEALEQVRQCETVDKLEAVYKSYEGELKENTDFIAALKSRKAKLEESLVK